MGYSEPAIASILSNDLSAVVGSRREASGKYFRKAVTCTEVAADFMTGAASICAAYYLYFSLQIGRHLLYPIQQVAAVAFVVGMLIALLMGWDGAYRGGISLLRIRETDRALRIPWQALLLLLPVTFFLGRTFSRGALVLALVILPILLIVQKQSLFFAIRLLHGKGYGVRRVVIYGGGYTGRRVLSALLQSPKLGLSPVAIIDDNPELNGKRIFELSYRRHRSVSVQHGPVTRELLKSLQCDLLVIAIPSLTREKFPATVQAAAEASAEVAFLPDQAVSDLWAESIDIDGLLLTSVGSPTAAWYYDITKRALDILGSSILLFLLSFVLVAISLLVRLDSPGPVFFVQERVGKKGRLFKMYKFRSMHTDVPKYGVSPTESRDRRITRVGRFLRRTSLDEIPQIFNVIKGDMSLVGPRPEMPFIVARYDPRQRQRLQVLPGITGLWQLSADRAFHIHENIQYDLYYIKNRSFFMDLAVLIHTAFFAMRGV